MPLYLRDPIQAATEVAVWKIEEEEAYFLERLVLADDEKESLDHVHPTRRIEWLTGRYLIKKVLGWDEHPVRKDKFEKPFLANSGHFISISHTPVYAGAMVAPHSCGIDIERVQERLCHVMPRLLSVPELDLLAKGPHPPTANEYTILWSAKEALYKAWGRRELDFRKHIHTRWTSLAGNKGNFEGLITKDGGEYGFSMRYERIEEYYLVSCVAIEGMPSLFVD